MAALEGWEPSERQRIESDQRFWKSRVAVRRSRVDGEKGDESRSGQPRRLLSITGLT